MLRVVLARRLGPAVGGGAGTLKKTGLPVRGLVDGTSKAAGISTRCEVKM